MKTVTVREAKTHLSQLITDVEAGEDVLIQRGRTNPLFGSFPFGHATDDSLGRSPGR